MTKEIHVKIPDREDFDEALVNLMKFFLDTETKAKIYLYLRKRGKSTSQEIAKGANLYPSSVREALAEMTKSGVVTREKLEVEGVGKNPYAYEAISPKELAKLKVKSMEQRLNDLFNLDKHLRDEGREISHPRLPFKIKIEKTKKAEKEKER
jgi:predicted transcriptional regulator